MDIVQRGMADINDGECRIADLALLAHRQGIHDDLCRVGEVHFTETQLVCHMGGKACQHIGLDPTAQAITQGADYLLPIGIA